MGTINVVLIKRQTTAASKAFRISEVPAVLVLTGTLADADGAQLLRYDAEANSYLPILDCEGDARGVTKAKPIGKIVAPGEYKVSKPVTAGTVGVQLQLISGLSSAHVYP